MPRTRAARFHVSYRLLSADKALSDVSFADVVGCFLAGTIDLLGQ